MATPDRKPGDELLVRYDVRGPVEWHVRLLLAQVDENEWCIATPDFDIYVEKFDGPDFRSVRDFAPGRAAPPGVAARSSYDFSEPVVGAALEALLAEGRGEAARFARLNQRPFPFRATVPAEDSQRVGSRRESPQDGGAKLPISDPLDEWIQRDMHRNHHIAGDSDDRLDADARGSRELPRSGQAVPKVPAGPPSLPPPANDDAHTLSVKYNQAGTRFREFRDAVEAMSTPVWPDWIIRGPRTLLWVLTFMLHNAGSPTQWHTKWRHLAKLQATDGGVAIHELCCLILEQMATYDQLDCGALASAETAARSIQLQEDRWRDRIVGSAGEHSIDTHLFTGTQQRVLCISPELEEWIAEENRKSAAMLKERRKAKEENHGASRS